MIYADSLFALNMAIDYFLLLCSARLCGAGLRRARFALAAALGGAYALLCVLPGTGFLSLGPVKLAAAALMSVAAYGGERRWARCFVAFLAVSAAFGGAVFALSLVSGTAFSGLMYVPVSPRVLAVSFAVCYAAVSFAFRRAHRRAEWEVVALTVTLCGKSAQLRALCDTGNELTDPVSGRPVAVAGYAALAPILPAGAPREPPEDAVELCSALSALPALAGRVSLVPYSSLGRSHGLLAALRPDAASAAGREVALLVGLSPRALGDGSYDAIWQKG